jgi:membrane protease YdiL (CAAX protease family)
LGKEHIADILKVLVLASGVAAYFIKDARQRRFAVIALLVACTALVGYTFIPTTAKDKDGKSQAVMDSSTAEFVMKLSSCFDDVMRDAGASGLGSVMGGADDKSKKMLTDMHEQALKSATQAVEHDPTSVPMRFRELVIAGESRLGIQAQLHDLKQREEPDAQAAALLIEELYEKHSVSNLQLEPDLKLVEKLSSPGWLRDVATIEVYRNAGEKKHAEKLLDDYHSGLINYIGRFAILVVTAVCLGLAGTLILFCQIFFWPRKLTSDEQRSLIAAPQAYGFLKVYGVFIGWLALECAVSPMFSEMVKGVKKPGGAPDPLTIALVIFVIYTINNVPALIIAWLVAIKPTGMRFVEAVKLRLRVGTTGPVRLILSGISAWLCAIPLIMVSALISKSMQSHGSASPILPIIAEVVRSGGFFTIFLFVFVLGVMPALCEETLFRGFLYTSLRVKHGVFYSVMVSATAFAAIHLDPGAFLQLFILGAVFALVMERTKSLLPSMIAHCLWNSGTLVLMMVAFGG